MNIDREQMKRVVEEDEAYQRTEDKVRVTGEIIGP